MPTKTKKPIKSKPVKSVKPTAARPMPTATIRPTATQKMSAWLWRGPAKFAALTIVLFIGVMVLLTLVASGFATASNQVIVMPEYLQTLFTAAFIFIPIYSIYKLVKWTPRGALDRHGFMGLSIVTTILTVIWLLLAYTCLRMGIGDTPTELLALRLLYISPTLFFIVTFLIMLIAMYILGIYLSAKTVAQYWRARGMGIPTWKFLCSFPFGWSILFYPQIFLPEDKIPAPALSVRPGWLASLTKWASAKTINALLIITIIPMLVLAVLMPGMATMALCAALVPIIIFFGLWAIHGAKKLYAAMPGWFSTMTIILNIIAIAAYALFLAFAKPYIVHQNTMTDQIEIEQVDDI